MAGKPARNYGKQLLHYLRKGFTKADNGVTLTVGKIPSGSLIHKTMSGVQVTTVFNAASGNVLDIGTAGNSDLFGTDLALGSLAFVPLDEAIGGYLVTQDETIVAVPALSGTAATTGAGEVVIVYMPDNDG